MRQSACRHSSNASVIVRIPGSTRDIIPNGEAFGKFEHPNLKPKNRIQPLGDNAHRVLNVFLVLNQGRYYQSPCRYITQVAVASESFLYRLEYGRCSQCCWRIFDDGLLELGPGIRKSRKVRYRLVIEVLPWQGLLTHYDCYISLRKQ